MLSGGALISLSKVHRGPLAPLIRRSREGGNQEPPLNHHFHQIGNPKNEERKSAIDAVKQITGARKEMPVMGGMSVGDMIGIHGMMVYRVFLAI